MPGLAPLPPPRINLSKRPRPSTSTNLFLLLIILQTQLSIIITTAVPRFPASILSPSFAVFHPQRRRLHTLPHRLPWSKTATTFRRLVLNSTRPLAARLHPSLELEAIVSKAAGHFLLDVEGLLGRLFPGTFPLLPQRLSGHCPYLYMNNRVKRSMRQIKYKINPFIWIK